MLRKEFLVKGAPKDASKLRVGIVVADFNSDSTASMLEGALETLASWRVKEKNITVAHVPGSYEIPLCVSRFVKTKKYDCVVAIGCIVKGETKHDEYIAHAVAQGLMRIMLESGVPVGLGVITPNTLEQAHKRSSGDTNHGASATRAALEMALARVN